jgi:hypothetical protein
MDHSQAKELTAVERYLLDELTPQERDDFEEHYFDCHDCSTDLRATAAFMDAARREFQANPVPKPRAEAKGKTFFASLWPSALVWSALAASLLVIAYQNAVTFPHFKTEIAELRAPEVLPVVSLVGGNSRGGEITKSTIGPGQSVLLSLDIPTQDRFSSYTCLLYSPSGTLLGRIPVSAQAAKDTVSIRVPAGSGAGEYTLTVQGNSDKGETPADLGHYRFVLNP